VLYPGQSVDAQGHLNVGGCGLSQLAEEYGTPLYVLDLEQVRERMSRYLSVFRARYPRSQVAYAGKAFLCAGFCPLIAETNLHLDVSTEGEFRTALAGGFPAEKLIFHGSNKSREELILALDHRVGRVMVDNFLELDLLTSLLSARNARQRVVLRLSPGIDPDTHELVATGKVDTKFGFDIASGAALEAMKQAIANPALEVLGIHCQIGSQLLDDTAHVPAIEQMVAFMKEVHDELGYQTRELNIGGGLGVRYTDSDAPPTVGEFAESIIQKLESELEKTGLPAPELWQEPGRSLIAEAGVTLYRVGARKEIPDLRTYVSVDGGMSDNIRPGLYGSRYDALVANKADHACTETVTISGKHCETDTLIRDIALPTLEEGDLLAVQCTGAYNYSMASNYNRVPRPPVVGVRGGQARLLVRRETIEDVLQYDVLP